MNVMRLTILSITAAVMIWPTIGHAQGQGWPWAGDATDAGASEESLVAQAAEGAGARGDVGIFADPELAGDPSADGTAWADGAPEDDMPIIDEINGAVTSPDFVPLQKPSAKSGGGINVAAYEELLKENMTLRRELDGAEDDRVDALADKRRIEEELLDMESQLTESVDLLQKLKSSGDGPDLDRIISLETELSNVASKNAKLRKQIDEMQAQASQPSASGPSPRLGSDLFKALQEETVVLKRQVRELQGERDMLKSDVARLSSERAGESQAMTQASEREAELQEALDRSARGTDKYKSALDKLLKQIPKMEQELAKLRDTVDVKNRELETHDQQVEAMQAEIEKRDWRLDKSERMQVLMERTREEVHKTNQKEKRDLHFNMAAVYAKEGRMRDAEKEYLRSLRIDPTDADSHYNLAILYEESFDNKSKAAVHYRAYLKLAPNARDVDEVKAWLIDLEMK